jgi:phosphoribosylformylglycinamidine synthase
MIDVLSNIMGQQVENLWHKNHDLKGVDMVILPGGFSYGDYLRSGAIARFSPVMQEVIAFAKRGGYVMGICNGFQILTEAGLVPGALLHNRNRKFICKNIYLKPETNNSLVSAELDLNKALKIPIAHGEGNYFAKPEELQAMKDQDQILFRYCDENAQVTEAANPNGSIDNIAGVCNEGRNVFGMMPHPERAADSVLANQDGLGIFESILKMALA